MSNALFPVLPGLSFSVKRSPEWKTIVNTAASGKESRIALWSAPRWNYELVYEFLRDNATAELHTLLGFFLQRQGRFDSFLFQDPDDNTISGQSMGLGDGTTTSFAAVRMLGGFVEPVIIDLTQPATWFVGGVATAVTYNDPATPTAMTFAAAPAAGAAITGSFSYLFRLRFDMELVDFEKFMSGLWEVKSLKMVGVK